jgi:hypothetical protein
VGVGSPCRLDLQGGKRVTSLHNLYFYLSYGAMPPDNVQMS